MLTLLLFIAAIVWIPVALGLFNRRPLTVLLVWLLIGPVVSNVIRWPGANPFFWSGGTDRVNENNYILDQTTITVKEILEPTRVVVLMMVGVYFLTGLLRKRRSRVPVDPVEKRMAFFGLLLVISSLFFSTRTAFSLRISLDVFIVPFLAYFLMRRLVRDEYDYSKVVRIIGFLGLYVAIACVLERIVNTNLLYRLKGPFVQGPFRGSSVLHIVLVVVFFAALLEVVRRFQDPTARVTMKRELRWFLVLTTPLFVGLTWARGNWIGFLAGVWLFILLGRQLVARERRMALVGASLILIPLVIILAQILVPASLVEDRIGETNNVMGRLETWRITFNEGLKNPILGVGLNNSRDTLARNRTEFEGGRTYTTVHNSYLAFFTELGVVGLLLYLSIVVAIARMGYLLYRKGITPELRWRGVAILSMLAAYLLPGLFASTLHMFGFGHVLIFSFTGALAGASFCPENLADPAFLPRTAGHRFSRAADPAFAGLRPISNRQTTRSKIRF